MHDREPDQPIDLSPFVDAEDEDAGPEEDIFAGFEIVFDFEETRH